MINKIKLITLENNILEVEPNEIETIKECFYHKTNQPYSKFLLKSRENEDFDNNRLVEVYESKAEIKYRIRQVEQRNIFSQN